MPNAIKYNVSTETLALKKGNFWIGTGDVGKGPTNVTGYYNGITPPSGGYTIYLNKESGGPSIYVATNNSQLVSLTNSIGAQSFTTSGQCLNWFATQTDKMVFNIDYPSIVTDGLVLNFDVGFTPSYPTTGTTLYDVSSGGNNGTLINGPAFNSSDGGSIVFDAVDDYITASQIFSGNMDSTDLTYNVWCYPTGSSSGFGALVNQGQYNYEPTWMSNGSSFWLWNYDETIIQANGLSQNKWYNVNVIKNGTNHTMTIYYDNTVFSQTVTSSKSGINWGDRGGNVNIYIGQNGAGEYYNGRIANVRVYNRALSASEVLQNYNAQKGRYGL
jgi:hypothetical protein